MNTVQLFLKTDGFLSHSLKFRVVDKNVFGQQPGNVLCVLTLVTGGIHDRAGWSKGHIQPTNDFLRKIIYFLILLATCSFTAVFPLSLLTTNLTLYPRYPSPDLLALSNFGPLSNLPYLNNSVRETFIKISHPKPRIL